VSENEPPEALLAANLETLKKLIASPGEKGRRGITALIRSPEKYYASKAGEISRLLGSGAELLPQLELRTRAQVVRELVHDEVVLEPGDHGWAVILRYVGFDVPEGKMASKDLRKLSKSRYPSIVRKEYGKKKHPEQVETAVDLIRKMSAKELQSVLEGASLPAATIQSLRDWTADQLDNVPTKRDMQIVAKVVGKKGGEATSIEDKSKAGKRGMAKRSAQERSALGRSGGHAAAAAMTPEERSERAKKAVAAREAKRNKGGRK